MGLFISRIYDALVGGFSEANPARICLLGLDNAGKTTLLYKLKLNEIVNSIPTIGFNVETVTPIKGVTFTVWDVGGQEKIRALWKHYYENTQGLLYVVDSADVERLQEAGEELFGIVEYDSMRDVPIVILCNKQDLPTAMSVSKVADGLGLKDIRNRWFIQASCAATGEGIYEGVTELAKMIKEQKRSSSRF